MHNCVVRTGLEFNAFYTMPAFLQRWLLLGSGFDFRFGFWF